jgi:hypothetical protein
MSFMFYLLNRHTDLTTVVLQWAERLLSQSVEMQIRSFKRRSMKGKERGIGKINLWRSIITGLRLVIIFTVNEERKAGGFTGRSGKSNPFPTKEWSAIFQRRWLTSS